MLVIRISKYFYVDSIVILIIFLGFCTGNIIGISVLYGAVFVHECAHFVSCVVLKEEICGIRFMPYGVNLQTRDIKNPIHTMIISASGPLMSLMLIFIFGRGKSEIMQIFKISNIAIFTLNIFPALPLDGGNFLKGFLTYKYGYVRSHRQMMWITRICSVVFAIFGIIFLLINKYNISLLVISGFLMYNLKEERKKIIFLRQMIFTKEFDRSVCKLRIKHMAVTADVNASGLTDYFGYNYICHFFVYDSYMNLKGTLTQSEIVDGITDCGADVTVSEILRRIK